MRIALRTSGGRGEYELSGSHCGIRVSDLWGCRISVELLPGRVIPTNNIVRHKNGKTRIRLANQRVDQHIYLVLANALLLPVPKRDIGSTPGGGIQLVKHKYSVSSINFNIVKKEEGSVLISPTDLIIGNSDREIARVDIIERMRVLLSVWDVAPRNESVLPLVSQHKRAFFLGLTSELKGVAEKLQLHEPEGGDVLRYLVHLFNIRDRYTYWKGLHIQDVEATVDDDDETGIEEAGINRIKVWRQQAIRGSSGRRFMRDVRQAYNSTCLFSGYYLPNTPLTGSAGVDSAHILPWAEYDLNVVQNGICLNKLCHWAFDSGILRLDFDRSVSEYVLSVTPHARNAEKQHLIDLGFLYELEGAIPRSRLPGAQHHWPNPSYLDEYNKLLSGL